MERMRRLCAPLAVCACALAQLPGVLVGRVWRFEDIAGYFQPLWSAAARQMRDGKLPTWDPGAWSGQPLTGDPQAGIFYPPNWLWLIASPLRAYAAAVLLHAALGGLGMYALARRRGRSRAASALAGIALCAGGFVVLQARHAMFVEAAAWLPWIAWAGLGWIETRRARDLAALAATIGLALATGGVSMLYYGALFCAVVLLCNCANAPSRGRALAGLGAAALLGAAAAAATLWPAAAHAPLSPRALGVDPHFAGDFAWPGFGYAVTLAVPNVLGDGAHWLGAGDKWELGGYYAGMLPLALALFALARGDRRWRGERIAIACALGLAVWLAREGSLAHRAAYHLLPLYAQMRCPARALFLFSLFVPLAAADGLDLVLARIPTGRRAAAAILAVALVALDLTWTNRAENPTVPLTEAERASRLDATSFLEQHPGERYVNDVHLGDHALHGSGLTWGLENASGYSSLPTWRYLHYLWIANHGRPYPYAKIHDDLSAQGLWSFGSPLVDALAVKWVLTAQPPNGPGYVKRFAGGDGVDVWENLEALPRARLVARVRVVDGPAEAASAIADPSFDPRREVVLERSPGIALDGGAREEVSRRVSGDYGRAITVECAPTRPAVLVLAEPFYPGWSATVDGAPAEVLAADLALRAVALPAGHHTVELRYRSAAVDRGLLVAGAAWLGILALALTRRRRR